MIAKLEEVKKRVAAIRKKQPNADARLIWADLLAEGIAPSIRASVFRYIDTLKFRQDVAAQSNAEPQTLEDVGVRVAPRVLKWSQYPTREIEGFTFHVAPLADVLGADDELRATLDKFRESIKEREELKERLKIAEQRWKVEHTAWWRTFQRALSVERGRSCLFYGNISKEVPESVYIAGTAQAAPKKVERALLMEIAKRTGMMSASAFEIAGIDGVVDMAFLESEELTDEKKQDVRDAVGAYLSGMSDKSRERLASELSEAQEAQDANRLSMASNRDMVRIAMVINKAAGKDIMPVPDSVREELESEDEE